jgi:D-alanine-D-alanine ligase
MRIAILQSAYVDASVAASYDEECDPGRYLSEHHCDTYMITNKIVSRQEVTEIFAKGYDVFINLCDGAVDEGRAGIEVVKVLDELGAAYTGAAEHFYEPTREQMKAACAAQGVKYPAFVMAKTDADIQKAIDTLRFPMIAKHPNSYGSEGLTKTSRVETPQDLFREAQRFITTYGSSLIEEFIEGREFTVLVVENPDDPHHPKAYQPVEFIFPQGETFKHYDMKWVDFDGMTCKLCVDDELCEKLKDAGRKLFLGLNANSYGRCDIRVDAQGEAYVLEINPNCGMFYPETTPGSADFVLLNDKDGHRGFLDLIIRAAINRRNLKQASKPL